MPEAMLHLAVKELMANLRSWWIVIMGLLCALLSWMIGSYGFSFASGEVGQQTVLVSLIHLQLYIVPLLGLLLAYDAILGERDSGMFDVHLALGIGRLTFLAGKWIGLCASLLIALLPSLLLQGIAFLSVGGSASSFVAVLVTCGLLSSAVVSIGLFVSASSLNRGTVVSLSIGAWLALAILLDFVVVSLLAATEGDVPDWLVNGLIVGNPLGAYRLLSYLHFFPDQVQSLQASRGVGALSAGIVMLFWILCPVLVTAGRLAREYRRIEWVAEESS